MTENPMEDKHPKVVGGVYFLYVSVVVGAIAALMDSGHIAEQSGQSRVLVLLAASVVFGPLWFLAYMIAKGRNWARITFLVLYSLGLLLSLFETFQLPSSSPFWNSTFTLQAVFQLIALGLLFHPDSSAWFKKAKSSREKPDREVSVPEEPSREVAMTEVTESEVAPGWEGTSQSGSEEEPLFVLTYRVAARMIFLVAGAFFILFFGLLVFVVIPKEHTFGFWFIVMEVFCGFVLLLFLLAEIELMNFLEIRLYKDKIVKVRLLGSDTEVRLVDARLRGQTGSNIRSISFKCMFNKGRSKYLANFKGVSYVETFAHPEDVKKLNRLLAELSERRVEEFEQWSIDLKSFIRPQQPDPRRERD